MHPRISSTHPTSPSHGGTAPAGGPADDNGTHTAFNAALNNAGNNAHQFNANPSGFSGSSVVNTFHIPSVGSPLPPHTPGAVANGENSLVRYNLPNAGANVPGNPVNLRITGPAAPGQAGGGQTAYWVPFDPGRTNGVSVPAHPDPALGQPTTVLTPGLSGCSFHATPDPGNPGNVVFSHAAQTAGGQGSSAIPPNGVGAGYASPNGYGPQRYPAGSPAGLDGEGKPNNANAASAFAYYKPGSNVAPGGWTVVQQPGVLAPVGPELALRPVSQNGELGGGISANTFPVQFPAPDA